MNFISYLQCFYYVIENRSGLLNLSISTLCGFSLTMFKSSFEINVYKGSSIIRSNKTRSGCFNIIFRRTAEELSPLWSYVLI